MVPVPGVGRHRLACCLALLGQLAGGVGVPLPAVRGASGVGCRQGRCGCPYSANGLHSCCCVSSLLNDLHSPGDIPVAPSPEPAAPPVEGCPLCQAGGEEHKQTAPEEPAPPPPAKSCCSTTTAPTPAPTTEKADIGLDESGSDETGAPLLVWSSRQCGVADPITGATEFAAPPAPAAAWSFDGRRVDWLAAESCDPLAVSFLPLLPPPRG